MRARERGRARSASPSCCAGRARAGHGKPLPARVLRRPAPADLHRPGAGAGSPKLIVADEAVSALDVSIKAQVINLMLDLQAELGLAYLFISHDMAVVERISHRVAVMYLGEIVEIGPRAAIIENPQHPYTRGCSPPCRSPIRRGARQRAVPEPQELVSPAARARVRAADAEWREPSIPVIWCESKRQDDSQPFPSLLSRCQHCPARSIVRGEGVYSKTPTAGAISTHRPMPASSASAMDGRDLRDALASGGDKVTFVYNTTLTHPWQEELAAAILDLAPGNMAGGVFRLGRLGGQRIRVEAGAAISRRTRQPAKVQGHLPLPELPRRDLGGAVSVGAAELAPDLCADAAAGARKSRRLTSIAAPLPRGCEGCTLAMRRRVGAGDPA